MGLRSRSLTKAETSRSKSSLENGPKNGKTKRQSRRLGIATSYLQLSVMGGKDTWNGKCTPKRRQKPIRSSPRRTFHRTLSSNWDLFPARIPCCRGRTGKCGMPLLAAS
ncbi:hypothetical protein KC362_g28 [Hortaea werneckii]|nr:hypothetical protein KC362_g28 [Hortaea werneckii]